MSPRPTDENPEDGARWLERVTLMKELEKMNVTLNLILLELKKTNQAR